MQAVVKHGQQAIPACRIWKFIIKNSLEIKTLEQLSELPQVSHDS
jgi:hypothetical protein